MTDILRLFVAVGVPDEVRDNLARFQVELRQADPDYRWVQPENFHLTLRFLGDVSRGRVEPLAQHLRWAAADQSPFQFLLAGAGAFPSLGRPRVLWAGVDQGRGRLEELAQAVEAAVEEAGFPPDKRRFSPHLAVARARGQPRGGPVSDRLRSARERVFGRIDCREMILMSSQLKRGGPVYTPVESFDLGFRCPS